MHCMAHHNTEGRVLELHRKRSPTVNTGLGLGMWIICAKYKGLE